MPTVVGRYVVGPEIPRFLETYPELAVEVQEICERYGLAYNSGRLSKQLLSLAHASDAARDRSSTP